MNHQTKVFFSVDNRHIIKISTINEIFYYEIVLFNLDYVKTFIELFVETLNYIKKKNYPIRQTIYKPDLHLFKNSIFINDYSNEKCVIETQHNVFFEEMMEVFDIPHKNQDLKNEK